MPSWRATIKDFLAAVEFDGREPTFTIERVDEEWLYDEKEGKEKIKLTAHFVGQRRGWVLNTTNCLILEALTGSDKSEAWIGKKVTLCAADVQLGKDRVKGIRIKGSPDLDKPMTVKMKIGRRQLAVKLVPTGKDAQPSQGFQEERVSSLKEMAEAEAEGGEDETPGIDSGDA